MGIHELLEGTPAIKKLIKKAAPTEDLFLQSVKDGMTTLKQDGIRKVFNGLTDMKEVSRVCINSIVVKEYDDERLAVLSNNCIDCPNSGGRKIMSKIGMVIDNDFFFVEFLGEALEKRGYKVIKGYDGKEAITKLKEGPVDVLFLDVIMPKIDGPTVIRFIREKFPEHSFPIVAVSSTFIERGDEIEEIGADFYFAIGPLEQMSEQVDRLLDELEGQRPDYWNLHELLYYWQYPTSGNDL